MVEKLKRDIGAENEKTSDNTDNLLAKIQNVLKNETEKVIKSDLNNQSLTENYNKINTKLVYKDLKLAEMESEIAKLNEKVNKGIVEESNKLQNLLIENSDLKNMLDVNNKIKTQSILENNLKLAELTSENCKLTEKLNNMLQNESEKGLQTELNYQNLLTENLNLKKKIDIEIFNEKDQKSITELQLKISELENEIQEYKERKLEARLEILSHEMHESRKIIGKSF